MEGRFISRAAEAEVKFGGAERKKRAEAERQGICAVQERENRSPRWSPGSCPKAMNRYNNGIQGEEARGVLSCLL